MKKVPQRERLTLFWEYRKHHLDAAGKSLAHSFCITIFVLKQRNPTLKVTSPSNTHICTVLGVTRKICPSSCFWEASCFPLHHVRILEVLTEALSRRSKKGPVLFRSSPYLPGPEGGQLHCPHSHGHRGRAHAGSSGPGSSAKLRALRPLRVGAPWPLTALRVLLMSRNAALLSPGVVWARVIPGEAGRKGQIWDTFWKWSWQDLLADQTWCELERWVKGDSKFSGPNNWKDGAAVFWGEEQIEGWMGIRSSAEDMSSVPPLEWKCQVGMAPGAGTAAQWERQEPTHAVFGGHGEEFEYFSFLLLFCFVLFFPTVQHGDQGTHKMYT